MTLSPDSTVGWGAAPVGGLGDEVSHKLPHNLKHFDYVSNKFSSCKTNTAYDLMDHSSESFKTFFVSFLSRCTKQRRQLPSLPQMQLHLVIYYPDIRIYPLILY